MTQSLKVFYKGLLSDIELYLEIKELYELGFTEEEVTGWIETYSEEILNKWVDDRKEK